MTPEIELSEEEQREIIEEMDFVYDFFMSNTIYGEVISECAKEEAERRFEEAIE